MTQQAREVSEFGPWIDHFEQNATVHAHVDAAIDFAHPGALIALAMLTLGGHRPALPGRQ
jgi:hypothetical protein